VRNLREAHAFRRQAVNVRGLDFRRPGTTDISRAKVVGENDDDVRLGLRREATAAASASSRWQGQ